MALNDRVIVDMPTSKITFGKQLSNGTIYVYYTKRAYRNSKGQPTSEKVAIGKCDLQSGKLIPNNNYFEIYNVTNPAYSPKTIKSYGNYYGLYTIADSIGLIDILKEVFEHSWDQILTSAMYMVCEGNVMYYCDDWCETTVNLLEKPITSQVSSELFKSISINDKINFFKQWVKKRSEQEYLAYDVTSISSYSKSIEHVEWGYNRDGEDLPQINLGMFYGETSALPIFYNVYSGSITDKMHLEYMMKYVDLLEITNVKFVMDNGFYKKENLRYMFDHHHDFIICLSNYYLFSKKIIDKNRDSIVSAQNRINEYSLFGVCEQYKQGNDVFNVHILYNEEKALNEKQELFSRVDKREEELKKKKKVLESISKYEKYYDIHINEDKTFTYEKNIEKINKEMSYTGYVLFMTTDLNKTTQEILSIYRNKDVIEKTFDNLKNEIDMKRLRTHTNATTDGKLFVAFIALILKSFIEKVMKKQILIGKYTTKKVLKELSKIKLTTLFDGNSILNPITKAQKDILEAFGTSEAELIKSLESNE